MKYISEKTPDYLRAKRLSIFLKILSSLLLSLGLYLGYIMLETGRWIFWTYASIISSIIIIVLEEGFIEKHTLVKFKIGNVIDKINHEEWESNPLEIKKIGNNNFLALELKTKKEISLPIEDQEYYKII